jgi:hypothetical protein
LRLCEKPNNPSPRTLALWQPISTDVYLYRPAKYRKVGETAESFASQGESPSREDKSIAARAAAVG